MPGNYEIAPCIHGNIRIRLIRRRVSIHPKLRAKGISRAIISLGVDAQIASILPTTMPSNHEIAPSIHGNGGIRLVRRYMGIDPELRDRCMGAWDQY
jgi:hypothetical protein